MPHSPEEKKRAMNRIKRIQGQCEGIQRSLENGADCAPVLMQLAAVRGAVSSMMSGILDSYIREEFAGKFTAETEVDEEVESLIKMVRSYFK